MKRFKKFITTTFTITPFKVTFTIVATFMVVSFANDISVNGLAFISMLDNKALDVKFQVRGNVKPLTKTIIVAIDDKSIQTFGQWPFDRAKVFAPLFEKLCSYGVKAVGSDVLWPETERSMSSGLKSEIRELARAANAESQFDTLLSSSTGDEAMRKAAVDCGSKIVFSYNLENSAPDLKSAESRKEYQLKLDLLTSANKIGMVSKTSAAFIPTQEKDTEDSRYPNTDYVDYKFGLLANNSIMMPAGVSQGYINNAAAGDDGNFRHYTPAMALNGIFLPSMSLKMAMKEFADPVTKAEAQAFIYIPDGASGKSMSVRLKSGDELTPIPVDKSGRMIVNYYGPNEMFPHVSLADVVSTEETISYTPSLANHLLNGGNPREEPKPQKFLKKEFFKNALVLVGATALGVHDIRPRPLASDAYGVENHATVLDNIISGTYLEKPSAETLLAILSALFVISLCYGLIINRLQAKPGFVFALVSVCGVLYFDQFYLFNTKRIVFSGHLQAVQFILQYVALTVIKYIKEETDKKFIRGAFDKFVSPAVIEQMLADPTKLKIGGEKKELSILFSDIAGFTELSERIDAKVLMQFLNEYLGAMTDIVQANNGTLDKYIGDAVMAFWGAPLDMTNHAQLATKTAVEMQIKLIEINKSFKERFGFEIEVRIGINSGEVSVGNFGSSKVFEYTVIGDSVNLASRLEGVNKYYGTSIIVSEATLKLLPEGSFTIREIDTIKVKGKHKSVKIFEVIAKSVEKASITDELIRAFREGLTQYYARHWDDAIVNFQQVLEKTKKDKAATEFIERCKYYKDNPPADDWDGSWEMTSK